MRPSSEVTSHVGSTRRLLALAAPGRRRFFTACGLGVLAVGSGVGLIACAAWLISAASLQPHIAALTVAIVGASSQRVEDGVVAGNSTDAGRSVTSKVTAILMVFADDGVHTLTEIAAHGDLPTSTAHRLASELVAWRLLERTEERHYRIGLPLRIIASEYSASEVCSTTQTVMRALPVLHELSRATRSEVRLGILRGSDVLTLQPRTNRFSERVHAEGLLHAVVPAHAAASGKALLAFSPPGVIDHVIAAGLPAFTPHTLTSPDVLRRKLSVIRLTQIATSRNELECGRTAIAMPIFYGGGRVAAAIELAIRDLGTELKPAAGALSVACRSLSRQLATEFRVTGNRHGHGTNNFEPALD
jgi:DNA-binding IclR family transcriptional regulator